MLRIVRPGALLLASAFMVCVACVTSGSNSSSVTTAQQNALDKKLFLFTCEELADEAKSLYAEQGYEERRKGLVFGPNGISLRGGSSFESKTSASSETKISLFGDGAKTETKVERRGKPDVSFVTEEHKGVQNLFSCWEKRDGAQMELKNVAGDVLDEAPRAYDDELELMKLIDEDGYDQIKGTR